MSWTHVTHRYSSKFSCRRRSVRQHLAKWLESLLVICAQRKRATLGWYFFDKNRHTYIYTTVHRQTHTFATGRTEPSDHRHTPARTRRINSVTCTIARHDRRWTWEERRFVNVVSVRLTMYSLSHRHRYECSYRRFGKKGVCFACCVTYAISPGRTETCHGNYKNERHGQYECMSWWTPNRSLISVNAVCLRIGCECDAVGERHCMEICTATWEWESHSPSTTRHPLNRKIVANGLNRGGKACLSAHNLSMHVDRGEWRCQIIPVRTP